MSKRDDCIRALIEDFKESLNTSVDYYLSDDDEIVALEDKITQLETENRRLKIDLEYALLSSQQRAMRLVIETGGVKTPLHLKGFTKQIYSVCRAIYHYAPQWVDQIHKGHKPSNLQVAYSEAKKNKAKY